MIGLLGRTRHCCYLNAMFSDFLIFQMMNEIVNLNALKFHLLLSVCLSVCLGLCQITKILLTKYDNLFECSFPYCMGWHGMTRYI